MLEASKNIDDVDDANELFNILATFLIGHRNVWVDITKFFLRIYGHQSLGEHVEKEKV